MGDVAERARALSDQARAAFQAWRLDEAEALYGRALALVPAAWTLHNLGTIRHLKGDYAGAERLMRTALDAAPDDKRTRASLGLVVLGQGRWAEGFALYDAWRDIPEMNGRAAPKLEARPWAGEPVAGKVVLVWSEEGFGDQIMFARFAALLKAEGARVIWVCDPSMTRLLGGLLGVQAAPVGVVSGVRNVDYYVPSSRLPLVFMRERLVEPPGAPYLAAPAPNAIPGLTLGVVARGNAKHDNDRNRSLPAEAAAELMALPGAVDLAPEATGAQDFYDTASVIAGLDLVITVDTSVAHLAGALGRPAWVLLPAIGTDWRWLQGRADSPWYPSLRLFRQTTPGDWSGVLSEVRAALAARGT